MPCSSWARSTTCRRRATGWPRSARRGACYVRGDGSSPPPSRATPRSSTASERQGLRRAAVRGDRGAGPRERPALQRHREPSFFTTSYLPPARGTRAGIGGSRFRVEIAVLAVEGPGGFLPDFASRWKDPAHRETLLRFLAAGWNARTHSWPAARTCSRWPGGLRDARPRPPGRARRHDARSRRRVEPLKHLDTGDEDRGAGAVLAHPVVLPGRRRAAARGRRLCHPRRRMAARRMERADDGPSGRGLPRGQRARRPGRFGDGRGPGLPRGTSPSSWSRSS